MSKKTNNRFYKNAAVVEVDGGWKIELDGREVRTPSGELQCVPRRALAQAMAAEWNEQGDKVDPNTMALCGLANAAIDRVTPGRETFIGQIEDYLKSDLVCYWAERPDDLVKRQRDAWQPLIDWMGSRFDVHLRTTSGIVHLEQPEQAVVAVRSALKAFDAFHLAACVDMVGVLGSVTIGLALYERHISPERAFQVAFLDELYQVETWGEDDEATGRREGLKSDLDATVRFLSLLDAEQA